MTRLTNYAPPPGRPGWTRPESAPLELLYLAWGWRRYRETPQQMVRRDSWMYFTPRRGTPLFVLPGQRRIPVKTGEILIVHPDCECGFDDVPGSVAEVCTWVWRSEPEWRDLRPTEGSFLKISLPDETAARVRALHDATRTEIQSSDEHTQIALELLRRQLDLILVRGQSERSQPASDEQRLALAMRWIDEHLDNHNPVTGLSDYLQLSPSTLNRLFQRGLDKNVRTFAKEARLRKARQLIDEQGWSVKETAYTLGYRFPNDLSRAFGLSRREK